MLGVVGDNIYITWSPRYDTSGSYKTPVIQPREEVL